MPEANAPLNKTGNCRHEFTLPASTPRYRHCVGCDRVVHRWNTEHYQKLRS